MKIHKIYDEEDIMVGRFTEDQKLIDELKYKYSMTVEDWVRRTMERHHPKGRIEVVDE